MTQDVTRLSCALTFCMTATQGEVLARRLYKDATERQSIPADPAILDYIRRTEPTDAAAGSGDAPAPPQPPAATTTSRPPPPCRPTHSVPQRRWAQVRPRPMIQAKPPGLQMYVNMIDFVSYQK